MKLSLAILAAWASIGRMADASASLPQIQLAAATESKALTISVPRASAAALLPEGLELALTPEGDGYPAMILFQRNHELRTVGSPLPAFADYDEVIAAVGGVRFIGGTRTYWYFHKLYLSSLGPTVLGYYLGFPKHLGQFAFGFARGFFQSFDLFGRALAVARIEAPVSYNQNSFTSNYERVKQALGQPVIANGYGPFVCSQFNFDFNSAQAYPVSADLTVRPGLAGPIAGRYQVPSLADSPIGGVSITASWTLDGPLPCAL